MSEQKLKSISEIENRLIEQGAVCFDCHDWIVKGNLRNYRHDGGIRVTDFGYKIWLYYQCPKEKCRYQSSISKIEGHLIMRKCQIINKVCQNELHKNTTFFSGGKYNPKIGDDDQKWFVPLSETNLFKDDLSHIEKYNLPITKIKCKTCLKEVEGHIALSSQIFGDD